MRSVSIFSRSRRSFSGVDTTDGSQTEDHD